jgi:hypothetical protein
MVGEIRDPETAQIAVQSALTGHLVFTTVHANNVFDVIGRFIPHGHRSLQLRLLPELRHGAAPGAAVCPSLPASGDLWRRRVLDAGINPERARGTLYEAMAVTPATAPATAVVPPSWNFST